MNPERVIMIFIDGIGLGKQDVHDNPFCFTDTPRLSRVLGGNSLCRGAEGFYSPGLGLFGLDATLGVEGSPQSATGQTTLFTGENAAALVGRHVNRYPGEKLKSLLREKGILSQLVAAGLKPTFAHAYRPEFFDDLKKGLVHSYSCSTWLTYYAGLPFRTLVQLEHGQALSRDLTHHYLNRMGYPVEIVEPEEAARRLLALSDEHDFTLFEYFLSDVAGHLAERRKAREIVTLLDRFLGYILEHPGGEKTMLIITSDHGNLEDLGHRGHTLNDVPALIKGPSEFIRKAGDMENIGDVVGLVKNFLDLHE